MKRSLDDSLRSVSTDVADDCEQIVDGALGVHVAVGQDRVEVVGLGGGPAGLAILVVPVVAVNVGFEHRMRESGGWLRTTFYGRVQGNFVSGTLMPRSESRVHEANGTCSARRQS